MKVLALDPGEKVGWARGIIVDGVLDESTVVHGINHLKDMALKLHDQIHNYDLVIYESFRLYPGAAKSMVGSDFPTAQFVGMVRLCAWANPNVDLVVQGATIKKTALKTAPDWLQSIISNAPKAHDDAHDVDALLHLWHWYWTQYIAKEAK